MEKHYTPTIDEFYVGYEYEYLSTSYSPIIVDHTYDSIEFSKEKLDVWEKKVLDLPKNYQPDGVLEYLSDLLSNKQIRTKYLDRDDILDLGFEEKAKYLPTKLTFYNKGEIFLVQYKDLTWSIEDKGNVCFYNGYVKSKNELRLILKFLNVDKL